MSCAPISGDPPITQNYGENPGGNNPPGGHNGRDYGVPVGTPVLAVTDGTILYEGWTEGEYNTNPWWFLPGDMVIVLQAGDGTQFVYGHLNTTSVNGGDRVREGQVIGTTGNTGKSTGPHLHFEALAPGYDLNNGMYGRTDPGPYIDNQTRPAPTIQEDTMAKLDPDDLLNIYNAVWYGVNGARLIPNESTGNGEWPYTTLGSMTARISRDIITPGLAGINRDTPDTGTIAAHLITALGDHLAADVVAEIGRQLAKEPVK